MKNVIIKLFHRFLILKNFIMENDFERYFTLLCFFFSYLLKREREKLYENWKYFNRFLNAAIVKTEIRLNFKNHFGHFKIICLSNVNQLSEEMNFFTKFSFLILYFPFVKINYNLITFVNLSYLFNDQA